MSTNTVENELSSEAKVGAKIKDETKPSGLVERKQASGPSAATEIINSIWPPVLGITVFVGLWAALAPLVQSRIGELPGPVQVMNAGVNLFQEGTGEFLGIIFTSLQTVALGFFAATLVAVPVGLIAGTSKTFRAAINPIVEVLRPVSPVAWLPIVAFIVAASSGDDPLLPQSLVTSAGVVMLNAMWPTLINTTVGAQSVDKDLLNVGEVLRLSWFQKMQKLVIPSALPYIFTGMRISLGIGWMVLIAAELLAQNPGLGKFVWDRFQNGSSETVAEIMFSVIIIGLIGFILDKIMGATESLVRKRFGV